MKTCTADEFEIEFYKAMHAWVQGGKVGPDPRGKWECDLGESVMGSGMPTFRPDTYRWKPAKKPAKKRTVVIDGFELVAPEVDAPALDAMYYVELSSGLVSSNLWRPTEQLTLANGKVFLTREDAQAMADAQRKQRMGGAS